MHGSGTCAPVNESKAEQERRNGYGRRMRRSRHGCEARAIKRGAQGANKMPFSPSSIQLINIAAPALAEFWEVGEWQPTFSFSPCSPPSSAPSPAPLWLAPSLSSPSKAAFIATPAAPASSHPLASTSKAYKFYLFFLFLLPVF